jgi:multiple sugar transport system substrate-binding protein
MRSRVWSQVLSIAIAGSLLLGGLGCRSTQVAQQQASVSPVKLDFWTVYDDVDQLKALVGRYTAARPYITVNIRQLRPEEVYQRLIEELAEDRGPDIISVRNRWMSGLKSKLATMPASVSDNTVQVTGEAYNSKTTINVSTRQMLTVPQLDREYVRSVKQDVVMDDQIYGLPLSLDTMAVFYNKDILDRAGIAEVPRTWKQMQDAVKKITKLDKEGKILQSAVAMGTSGNIPGFDDVLYALFEQSGLRFVDRTTGRPRFQSTPAAGEDQPAGMSVLDFYTDFANPASDLYSWNDVQPPALDSFANGSLAFFFGYSYHTSAIRARAPQLNFGVVPLFQFNPESPVNVANYWVQAVTKKSKNQAAAWGLIDYLAHSPVTKEYLDKTNRPTALRTYITAQQDSPDLGPFVSQVLVANSWYHGQNYDAAAQAVGDMIREWRVAIPENESATRWRQNILNRAASKIDQTF